MIHQPIGLSTINQYDGVPNYCVVRDYWNEIVQITYAQLNNKDDIPNGKWMKDQLYSVLDLEFIHNNENSSDYNTSNKEDSSVKDKRNNNALKKIVHNRFICSIN